MKANWVGISAVSQQDFSFLGTGYFIMLITFCWPISQPGWKEEVKRSQSGRVFSSIKAKAVNQIDHWWFKLPEAGAQLKVQWPLLFLVHKNFWVRASWSTAFETRVSVFKMKYVLQVIHNSFLRSNGIRLGSLKACKDIAVCRNVTVGTNIWCELHEATLFFFTETQRLNAKEDMLVWPQKEGNEIYTRRWLFLLILPKQEKGLSRC